MGLTFCRILVTLMVLSSLDIMGPGFVSCEELSCQEIIALMRPGTRVVRGRDWKWDNQDGNPPSKGTVLADKTTMGWVRVRWDTKDTNAYRMGDGGKCDLKIVQEVTASNTHSSTPTTPRPESQSTCSKEISATEAETAELAKEAAKISVETARVVLEAAKFSARVEEAKAKEAENVAEASRIAIVAAESKAKAEEAKAQEALLQVSVKEVYLQAAKIYAAAEQSWAINAAEDLEFERIRRNLTLKELGFLNTKP